MTKVNVANWIWNDDSKKVEEQVKYAIACEAEGYLNGIRDCGTTDYPPMTRENWIKYVEYGIELLAKEGMTINNAEYKHLRFFGKENIRKLIEAYIDNYAEIQAYVIR